MPRPLMTALRCVAIAVVAAVAWLCLTPAPPPSGAFPPGFDLVVHFLMFFAAAAALATAWPGRGASWFAVALAAGLEAAQNWVPGRDAALSDLAANGAGLSAGLLAAAGLRRVAARFFRRPNPPPRMVDERGRRRAARRAD